MFYGEIFLFIHGIDCFVKNITNNSYVIIGFFIVKIIYELIIYLSIYVVQKGFQKGIFPLHTDIDKVNIVVCYY